MPNDLQIAHKAFINFLKRAEKNSDDILYETFVDSAPLSDLLATKNNQVVYGRRGTGKTHALRYLAKHIGESGKIPIYVDLQSIGSDGALNHDSSRPFGERSIRLILDVLKVIGDELYSIAVAKISDAPHPDQITARLDDFMRAISDVRIVGEHEVREKEIQHTKKSIGSQANLKMDTTGPAINFNTNTKAAKQHGTESEVHITGQEKLHIEFGRVQGSLRSLLGVIGNPEIWLLIDEWSEIPLELQPYLAELFRRSVLPIENFVIKIAAIEHRSMFATPKDAGGYIGLELGADINADLNLDDFLVFDNDKDRAIDFFKNLLFRHYRSYGEEAILTSPDELIRVAFTQYPVFEEFVRAVEGVPRDALSLAAKAAVKAFGNSISMEVIRIAARDWYHQDKAAVVRSNPNLDRVLTRIIDTVIAGRRARAF